MNAQENMLNIILPDGEVAHLIRIIVESTEGGTGAIHCTLVRDNWDFQEILLDEAAFCDAPKD
jgi:hypothetical protein